MWNPQRTVTPLWSFPLLIVLVLLPITLMLWFAVIFLVSFVSGYSRRHHVFEQKKRKLWKPHYKTSAPKQMEDLVTTLWIAAHQFATSEWNISIIFSENGLMVIINANLTPGCVNKHLLMNIMTTNNIPVLWFQLFLPFPKDWLLNVWCFKMKHFFALIIQRDRRKCIMLLDPEGHRSLMQISVVQTDTKYSDCCYWKCGFCLSVYNFTFTSFVCSKQSVWTCVYLYVQKNPKQSHSSQSCSPSYAQDQKKKKKKKKTLQLLLNNKRQGFNV